MHGADAHAHTTSLVIWPCSRSIPVPRFTCHDAHGQDGDGVLEPAMDAVPCAGSFAGRPARGAARPASTLHAKAHDRAATTIGAHMRTLRTSHTLRTEKLSCQSEKSAGVARRFG